MAPDHDVLNASREEPGPGGTNVSFTSTVLDSVPLVAPAPEHSPWERVARAVGMSPVRRSYLRPCVPLVGCAAFVAFAVGCAAPAVAHGADAAVRAASLPAFGIGAGAHDAQDVAPDAPVLTAQSIARLSAAAGHLLLGIPFAHAADVFGGRAFFVGVALVVAALVLAWAVVEQLSFGGAAAALRVVAMEACWFIVWVGCASYLARIYSRTHSRARILAATAGCALFAYCGGALLGIGLDRAAVPAPVHLGGTCFVLLAAAVLARVTLATRGLATDDGPQPLPPVASPVGEPSRALPRALLRMVCSRTLLALLGVSALVGGADGALREGVTRYTLGVEGFAAAHPSRWLLVQLEAAVLGCVVLLLLFPLLHRAADRSLTLLLLLLGPLGGFVCVGVAVGGKGGWGLFVLAAPSAAVAQVIMPLLLTATVDATPHAGDVAKRCATVYGVYQATRYAVSFALAALLVDRRGAVNHYLPFAVGGSLVLVALVATAATRWCLLRDTFTRQTERATSAQAVPPRFADSRPPATPRTPHPTMSYGGLSVGTPAVGMTDRRLFSPQDTPATPPPLGSPQPSYYHSTGGL